MRNLPSGTVVKAKRKIQTDQGLIAPESRGIIRGIRQTVAATLYEVSWPHPEPLDLPSICTGAGGDLDDECITVHAHNDRRVSLVDDRIDA